MAKTAAQLKWTNRREKMLRNRSSGRHQRRILLTLEAALDTSMLVVGTKSMGWHEAPALITLHAHSADHWTSMLPRIDDDPINHCKDEQKEKGIKVRSLIIVEKDGKFFLFLIFLTNCLTAIGCAFWTHNNFFLLDVIDRIAVGQQDKGENGSKHQIYRHNWPTFETFRKTFLFIWQNIHWLNGFWELRRFRMDSPNLYWKSRDDFNGFVQWRVGRFGENSAHHATASWRHQRNLRRRSFSLRRRTNKRLARLSDVPFGAHAFDLFLNGGSRKTKYFSADSEVEAF